MPLSSLSLQSRGPAIDERGFQLLLRRASSTLLVCLIVPLLAVLALVRVLVVSAHWTDHSDQVITQAREIEVRLMTVQAGIFDFSPTRERSVRRAFAVQREGIRGDILALQALVADNPGQFARAQILRRDGEAWLETVEAALGQAGRGPIPALAPNNEQFERLRADMETFVGAEQVLRDARNLATGRLVDAVVAAFAIAVLIGAPGLAFWLYRLLHKLMASYHASLASAAERSAELEVTLRSIGDGVIAVDLAGKVVFMNPTAESITGWTKEEAAGRDLAEVFSIHNEETGAAVANPVERVLRENILVGLANHTVLRSRSGDEYPIEDSAAPIRDRDGTVRGVILVFHNVAEKRAAEQERARAAAATREALAQAERARQAAELASRAKDDFLASLSHELRTPLTPVLMAAGALRLDPALPEGAREQLAMMERNIGLEARLIDDLLDLTVISRGKVQLRTGDCDAHALIGMAIETVSDDARAKEITIERRLEAGNFRLEADADRFQQVIWNLLRNGIKFSPRQSNILIHTADQSEPDGSPWLRISVADAGIGIAPSRLEEIFQPFEQGGHGGDHRFGGIGLGLAIARAIVSLHGGRIRAESAGLNRGATFVVELPAAGGSPPAAEQPEAAPAPSAPASPLRLLLVEDHESTLQTTLRLLERDGHQVVPARSLAEAFAAAAPGRFDLVISDLGLPDGTGYELMAKLRDTQGLRGIALSGYGTKDDRQRSSEAGFVAHLVKPIRFADLRQAIAAARS